MTDPRAEPRRWKLRRVALVINDLKNVAELFDDEIKVIEASAFEAVVKERDKAMAQLVAFNVSPTTVNIDLQKAFSKEHSKAEILTKERDALVAENERLRKLHDASHLMSVEAWKERDALAAKLGKAREALKNECCCPGERSYTNEEIKSAARKALEETGGE